MPQPVTALAGSDAYLGHQKQDVGEFNPSCPGPRDVVCALPQGIQERQEEAARVGHDRGMDRIMGKLCLRHSEVLEEQVVETVQFTHECVELSTVSPRL